MSNVYDSHVHLLQRAAIAIGGATSGAQALVAPVAGKLVRLCGFRLSALTACAVKFQATTAEGSRDLSGLIQLAEGEEVGEPLSIYGHLETAVGEGISLHTSAAAAIGGYQSYLQF
jgi:hypothetical protein